MYGNPVKLLADWCWQSEVGQIGWFSNFYEVSIDFLQYKNGSKNFYDLLRPIETYTE